MCLFVKTNLCVREKEKHLDSLVSDFGQGGLFWITEFEGDFVRFNDAIVLCVGFEGVLFI